MTFFLWKCDHFVYTLYIKVLTVFSGYGHASPCTTSGRIVFIFYALTSIPLNMLLLNVALEVSVTSLTNVFKRLASLRIDNSNQEKGKTHSNTVEINIRGVLLLISAILLCIVTVTATMFCYIEEWSFLEGVYFTIVSFTTVGLGDYVPFKTRSNHNTYPAYKMLNLVVIIIGSIFTYILLNLQATIYKNMIHYMACSSLIDANPARKIKEVADNTVTPRRKLAISRFSSISSTTTNESNAMGSFAAIQRAIDRIRSKSEEDNSARANEMKAVNTIEAILQSEYEKIRARQGDDPGSRWKRAAAKVRLSRRRKQSNVYRSVLFDSAIQQHAKRRGSSINKRDLKSDRALISSNMASRRIPQKSLSELPRQTIQEALLLRRQLSAPHLATFNNAFNIQSYKENKAKLSITHEEEQLQNSVTYEDILKERLKDPISRQSTKSTYLPSDYDNNHISPGNSRESTPDRTRRMDSPRPKQILTSNNNSHSININILQDQSMNQAHQGDRHNGNDTQLTYEEIVRLENLRRRRSTKSTYISSVSKSRRSSMELDDIQSCQSHESDENHDDEIFSGPNMKSNDYFNLESKIDIPMFYKNNENEYAIKLGHDKKARATNIVRTNGSIANTTSNNSNRIFPTENHDYGRQGRIIEQHFI